MTPPMRLALACAAVPACMVEARLAMLDGHLGPSQLLGSRVKLAVKPRQFEWPPWWFPDDTTTTTTLTVPTPGPATPSSIFPSEPPGSDGTPTTTTSLSASLVTPQSATGNFQPSTAEDWQTSSEVLLTDTMPTDIATSAGIPTTTDFSHNSGTSSTDGSETASNRTLVIALSTVFSVVGVALIAGAVFFWWRRRQRRLPFLSRGVTPIDDDEIAAWKTPRDEKACFPGGDTDIEADGPLNKEIGGPSHAKQPSTSSVKKPPSVIVYSHGQGRRHSDASESHRSFGLTHHTANTRTSLDRSLPQTPIQARAPNARAGLTDESVPGDEPFLPSPRRNSSRRLSRHLPNSSSATAASHRRAAHHARARSSRSSTRSFGDYSSPSYYYGHGSGAGSGGSDVELAMSPPRHSHDFVRHSSRSHGRNQHSRVYSSSSVPPRLSFGDEVRLNQGVSQGPSSGRRGGGSGRGDEIGRAIG